jgi:hypothetical protein
LVVLFGSDGFGNAGPDRAQSRLADLERGQIVARRIQGLAFVFDRAQEFAHGASEAIVEPGTREKRAGNSSFGIELNSLMTNVEALAGSTPFAPMTDVESRAPYRVAPSKTSDA